jgi:hypothetical protein
MEGVASGSCEDRPEPLAPGDGATAMLDARIGGVTLRVRSRRRVAALSGRTVSTTMERDVRLQAGRGRRRPGIMGAVDTDAAPDEEG